MQICTFLQVMIFNAPFWFSFHDTYSSLYLRIMRIIWFLFMRFRKSFSSFQFIYYLPTKNNVIIRKIMLNLLYVIYHRVDIYRLVTSDFFFLLIFLVSSQPSMIFFFSLRFPHSSSMNISLGKSTKFPIQSISIVPPPSIVLHQL